jgi:hypothetical protein
MSTGSGRSILRCDVLSNVNIHSFTPWCCCVNVIIYHFYVVTSCEQIHLGIIILVQFHCRK